MSVQNDSPKPAGLSQMTCKAVDKDRHNSLETYKWFFENLSTKKLQPYNFAIQGVNWMKTYTLT